MACCFRYKPYDWEEERGCQFASETDFITLGDGTTWCRLHLPMRDAAGNDSPKAGWDDGEIIRFNQADFHIIDAAINAGYEENRMADLSGIVFPGNVKFSQYDGERPFSRISFHYAAFSGNADFHEAAFSGEADFKEVTFDRYADFRVAAFSEDAIFEKVTFSGKADFREAAFSDEADFKEVAFSEAAYFDVAAFLGPARFQEAAFLGEAGFLGTAFSGHAYFEEADFSGDSDFREAAFSGDSNFREAAFSGIANFREAAFSGNADFREAVFSGYAYFGKAAFSGPAYFGKTAFSRVADFVEASFSGYAGFYKAAFSGNAYFREVAFLGPADFSGAAEAPEGGGRRYDMRLTGTPDGDAAWRAEGEAVLPTTPSRSTFQRVDFSGATLGGTATFNNRRFTDSTRFHGAIFERAPKFHNAVLHQDTDFEGADFRDVRSPDAERNYRTLKLAMEKVRSRREEAMFFALEQRSLRNQPATPRMEKFVSWLYDKAAEYGQNFVLPLLWMTFISAAFVNVYYGVLHYMPAPAPACEIDFLGFTLKQVFRPFEVWSSRPGLIDPIAGCGDARMVLRALATLQTLVTYALLTLFLLALRKRFRML